MSGIIKHIANIAISKNIQLSSQSLPSNDWSKFVGGGLIAFGYPLNCFLLSSGSFICDSSSSFMVVLVSSRRSAASCDFAIVALDTDARSNFSSSFSLLGNTLLAVSIFPLACGLLFPLLWTFGSVSRRILCAVRGTLRILYANISLSLSILFNLLMSATVQLNLKAIDANVSFTKTSASRICSWRMRFCLMLSLIWIPSSSSIL